MTQEALTQESAEAADRMEMTGHARAVFRVLYDAEMIDGSVLSQHCAKSLTGKILAALPIDSLSASLTQARDKGFAEGIEAAAKAKCKWCRIGEPIGSDPATHRLGNEGGWAWCESVEIRALSTTPIQDDET